eukprot:3939545-Rhodomonas_salina.1
MPPGYTCGCGVGNTLQEVSASEKTCKACISCSQGQYAATECTPAIMTACESCPAGSQCLGGQPPTPCPDSHYCPGDGNAYTCTSSCTDGTIEIAVCNATTNTVCSECGP